MHPDEAGFKFSLVALRWERLQGSGAKYRIGEACLNPASSPSIKISKFTLQHSPDSEDNT